MKLEWGQIASIKHSFANLMKYSKLFKVSRFIQSNLKSCISKIRERKGEVKSK